MTLTQLKNRIDKLVEDGYGDADVISSHDGDVIYVLVDGDGSLVTIVTEE